LKTENKYLNCTIASLHQDRYNASQNDVYLMDCGTCAKTFENLWSRHKRNLGVGRIYSKGDKSGFLQVVAKAFFKGQTTAKFSFYKLET